MGPGREPRRRMGDAVGIDGGAAALLQCDLDAMRGEGRKGNWFGVLRTRDLSEMLLLDEMIAVLDAIGHS